MNNVYIFDVDGTLTPSRKPMTKEFQEVFFDEWSKKNTFYLVSGSDLEKMSEQVPPHILERAAGLFCCGGNDYPLANLMNNTDDCYSFQAGEPSDEFGFT